MHALGKGKRINLASHGAKQLDTSTSDVDDDEFDKLCDRRCEIERAMNELPSQSIEDAALKLSAYTDQGRNFGEDGKGTGKRLLREMIDLTEARALIVA